MTWSLTLPGLPREGSFLKLRHYKQKLQKMKDLSKTWVLSWEHFEDLRWKKTETFFLTFQKTQWNTWLLNATVEKRIGN